MYISSVFVFYNICTVHGADLTHISLLVIYTLYNRAGPCRDLWRSRCSKYERGTWNTAFNRAVLLADMCIEMDASVLIQQQMP